MNWPDILAIIFMLLTFFMNRPTFIGRFERFVYISSWYFGQSVGTWPQPHGIGQLLLNFAYIMYARIV